MDTAQGFFYSFFQNHGAYISLFKYIEWDEKEIISTLIDEYDWELATDTTNTWRIGDGTAAFYNYIYYTVAGFTENDGLRSNQIREGVLTRERAIELLKEENKPRFDSLQWYADVIQLEPALEQVLESIHSIPKLY